jgi:AraC-like DNA-binding protein/mannose-6-phosphate isomerase-like protein (cupin superfamily)
VPDVHEFVDDLMVVNVFRPGGLRAGFHADVGDPDSGLQHAGEQWAPARLLIRPHTHSVWEFYLQAHGVTRWAVGKRAFSLLPGHLFAVAPGVRHRMSEESGGNHHFYYAAVDPAPVLARRPSLATTWQHTGPVIHQADGRALADPFDDLMRELAAQRQFLAEGITLAVDRLIVEITRLLVPSRPAPQLTVHPAITRVREMLDQDYDRAWTLRQLADRVGLAPTYLAGLFTSEMGDAPHRYLLRRRVDRARRMLETTDLSVTTIGIDVGFGSGQHFARAFRRLTGCSPREYRQRTTAGSG